MFNYRQFSLDVVGLLMSAPSLLYVPFKAEWKMHLEQEVDLATTFEVGRNGKFGAMGIVHMPEPDEVQRNVSGAIENQYFDITVIEQVDINTDMKGTGLFCEEICARVKDVLHLHADDKYGTIAVAGRQKFTNEYPGCIAYRIPFILPKAKSASTLRTQTVLITNTSGQISMSSEDGAKIFYTLDNSFPGNENAGNANSHLYTQPFSPASGATIRAVAYAQGKNQSEARQLIIP